MWSLWSKGILPFLFGQNPFSSYDFRPESIEENKIISDILLNGELYCMVHYALKATQWAMPSLDTDKHAKQNICNLFVHYGHVENYKI